MRSKFPGLKALMIPAATAVGLCGVIAAGPAEATAPGQAASAAPKHVATNLTKPARPEVVSPNLLSAGSFEQSIAGWQRLTPPGAVVNWADYDTSVGAPSPAHDGTGYLATNSDTAGGSVYQEVSPYGAGGVYQASVWLSSASGTATGTFCLWSIYTANNSLCSNYSVDAATGYQNYVLIYGVPVPTGTLRFQIYPSPNGGTTNIDTASLQRIS